jgi:hypothetical protein
VAEENTDMEQFFAKVSEVREKMAAMSAGQQELMRLHDESKTAVQVSLYESLGTLLSMYPRKREQIWWPSLHSNTPELNSNFGY